MANTITLEQIQGYRAHLHREERAPGTIEKYLRDVRSFAVWLGEREISKEAVASWKEHLMSSGYDAGTVNVKLAAVNAFLRFADWEDCRVKSLKRQRRVFREHSRELTREEYERLLRAAGAMGRERLELLMETICATGIRVSETRYITVEAAKEGKAEVSLKGKVRTILLPAKLCRKLLKYAKRKKIASGEIFLTRSGKAMTRKQIWAEMKSICKKAGVETSKVYPHNLRHLLARCFYRACRDIAKLADVLGHSSVETTRIYLISTGAEHAKTLEGLRLVS